MESGAQAGQPCSPRAVDLLWLRAQLLRGLNGLLLIRYPELPSLFREVGLPSMHPRSADAAWPVLPLMKLLDLLERRGHGFDVQEAVCRNLCLEDAGGAYLRRLAGYRTLEQALHGLPRDGRLISNLFGFHQILTTRRYGVSISIPLDPNHRSFAFWEWTAVILMIRLIQYFLGASWVPEELRLRCQTSKGPVCEGPLKSVRLLHEQQHTFLSIPAELQNFRQPESVLFNLRNADPEEGFDFTQNLKQIVKAYLVDGYPSIGVFAKVTGRSERSVQRDLAKAGCTYSDLVEEARCEWAMELLENSELQILDIALELGYGDASHFARAFRRWMGISPGAYRKGALLYRFDSSSKSSACVARHCAGVVPLQRRKARINTLARA